MNQKALILALTLLLVTFTASGAGLSSTESLFQSVKSGQIKLIEESYQPPQGVYPFWYKWVVGSAHWWVPDGSTQVQSTKCDLQKYQGALLKSPNLAMTMREYLNQCEDEVQVTANFAPLQIYKLFNMKFQQHEHPYMRRVMIELPNGVKVKGLLGLKGDNQPRPLVIVRGGVHSTIDEMPPERFLAMQLFEQSPYHVLMLGNMTGLDFIEHNSKFAYGGFDEGLQNIQIAKLLTHPQQPISKKISQISLAGLSLGGHGVFYAAMLNQLNGSPFNSFVGLCPVVNLKPTMQGLLHPLWKAWVVDFWTLNREKKYFEKYPEIILPKASDVLLRKQSILQILMDNIEKNYQGGLSYSPEIQLPQGEVPQRFWQANDIWTKISSLNERFLILYNKTDPLVNPEENVKKLPDNLWQQAVLLQNGVHCTIPIGYDWEFLRLSLETFLARGFAYSRPTNQFRLSPDGKLQTIDQHLENQVLRKVQLEKVSVDSLQLAFVDGDSRRIELPVSWTDYPFASPQPAYFEMMQRWVQARVQVYSVGENIFLQLR